MTRPPGCERRSSDRHPAAACDWLAAVRLRFGEEMSVIDVSLGGLLVETAARLLPNARVDLQATILGDTQVIAGRVLRSQVCAIVRSGIRYRAAVAFGVCLDIPSGTWFEGGPGCPTS